jgi:hypothetical protein
MVKMKEYWTTAYTVLVFSCWGLVFASSYTCVSPFYIASSCVEREREIERERGMRGRGVGGESEEFVCRRFS